MANLSILRFNTGEVTPHIDVRSDVEKYSGACRILENFIPRIYGDAERRPGFGYIATSYNSTAIVRKVPFVYSATIAYTVEFGNLYARIFYDGSVVATVITPYLTADLFELQFKQINDVMWIVHPSYAQRKLSRITASTFSLDVIEFNKGPFLIRNDLVDTDETGSAVMSCTATALGTRGTLTCGAVAFDDDHVGAIFKLIHPRTTTISDGTATTIGIVCAAIDVKGDFKFNTGGNWGATIVLQRRQNSTSDNDWENFRTFKGVLTNGAGSRNVQAAYTEDEDNVEYRANVTVHTGGTIEADITVDESTQTGIVRIESVTDAYNAEVVVLKALASTNATKKWAEGAWSDYRGYPSSITFRGERCIYAGSRTIISRGSVTQWHTGLIGYLDRCILDNGNIFIVFRDTDDSGKGKFIILDGYGDVVVSETVFKNADTYYISAATLSNGNVVISYALTFDTGEGFFVIYDEDGNEVVSEVEFEPDVTTQTSVTALDNGNFLIAYESSSLGQLVIHDADGAQVKAPTTFSGANDIDRPEVALLDNTNVFIVYRDKTDNNYGRFVIYDEDGTEVKSATTFDANNSVRIYDKPVVLSNTNIVISYSRYNNRDADFVIYDEDGNEVKGHTIYEDEAATFNENNSVTEFEGQILFAIGELASDLGYKYIYTLNGILVKDKTQFTAGEDILSPNCSTFANNDLAIVYNGEGLENGYIYVEKESILTAKILGSENMVWLSEVGEYEDFEEGINDADSFSLRIPTSNRIRWVETLDALFVGTTGDEWLIRTNELDTPLTPTNFSIKQISNYGSAAIQPVKINEQILFVDFVKRKVRELVYTDDQRKYVAPDLSSLAEHITYSGITSIAIQRNPDSILWCTLDDGSLISTTYEREQNVVAWSKQPVGGTDVDVQSVCVIPAASEDEVLISVRRTINSSSVTYIERAASRTFTDIDDAFFVDSGLTTSAPAASITLAHLVGETVVILADGVEMDTQTVGAGGTTAVELDGVATNATTVQAGLAFTYTLQSMRADVIIAGGTTHGSIKKVSEMVISFLNTLGAKYGDSASELYDINFTDERWVNNTEITGLFTGDVIVALDGGFNVDDPTILSGSGPMPCTIRAMVPRTEKVGR